MDVEPNRPIAPKTLIYFFLFGLLGVQIDVEANRPIAPTKEEDDKGSKEEDEATAKQESEDEGAESGRGRGGRKRSPGKRSQSSRWVFVSCIVLVYVFWRVSRGHNLSIHPRIGWCIAKVDPAVDSLGTWLLVVLGVCPCTWAIVYRKS